MSDWINKESEKTISEGKTFEKIKDEIYRKKCIIADSNFMMQLRKQIESDVEKINNNSAWSGMLRGSPLRIIDLIGGNYTIQKPTSKVVSVALVHKGDEVLFEFQIYESIPNALKGSFEHKNKQVINESWLIDVENYENGIICLKRENEIMVIPEQVSRHIFKPFIDVLNDELKV